VIAPLATLSARRVAPRSTWILLAATAGALLWGSNSESPAQIDARFLAALQRRETWTTLGALLAALVVYRASTLSLDWRRRDSDAFSGAPRSRLDLALSMWTGAFGAALTLTLALAVFVEGRAVDAAPWDRELGRARVTSSDGPHDERRLLASLSTPRGARWIELDLGFLATEVSATLELTARRDGDIRRVTRLVSSRTRLRVAAPNGDGEVELELRRSSGGGLVFLATDEVKFLGDAHSPRWASVVLALHASLAAAAWIALAFALGAYLPPLLASIAAFALATPSWLGEHPAWSSASPWGSLPGALEAAGRGAIPALPEASVVASTAVVVALSLALATRGLRTWRVTR